MNRKLALVSLLGLVTVLSSTAAGGAGVGGAAPGRGAHKAPGDQKAGFVPPGFSPVVIFATNSVDLDQGSQVMSGSVVVNTGGSGQTLGCSNRRLCVGISATTPAGYAAKADSIQIKSQGAILGTASCNSLVNNGSQTGLTCSPLTLPVFAQPPAFTEGNPHPGASDVHVPQNGTATLAAGDYGILDARQNAVVTLGAGIYNVEEIDFGTSTTLQFLGPAEVRVRGKLSIDENSFVGPATGSGIDASDIVFFVAGVNGNTGTFGATPKAAKIGINCDAQANFYVPNGTLQVRQNASVEGALLARDVQVGQGVTVSLDSFFANQAPSADPLHVATAGATSITITLTGHDPDGDDLVFSIVPDTGPTHGSLGPVTQGPPASPGNPPGCSPDDCIDPPVPARTSATVVYTPAATGDVEDDFVFAVTDTSGQVGTAAVRINPAGDPTTPDPPLTTAVARDVFAETTKDHDVVVQLEGDAPDGVSLTFAIVAGSGPAHGSLSAVTQGSESPQRFATVTYQPDAGFTGSDSFGFSVCGTIGGSPSCDDATASVTVASGSAVAIPQDVETPEETDVTIALSGIAGVGEESLLTLSGKAAFLDGAEIAGNVADATGDGLGDNHNDLPGATPGLMAAAVDASGGPGSNGVLRMQIEWNITGIRSTVGSLTSAHVFLHTNKGTVDSLDTTFFVGTGIQDAALTNDDFEAPASPLPGVVMPVPAGPSGTDGTFSFDVLGALQAAVGNDDLDVFSIQGRVDEGLAGGGFQRGLQVYTTASGNLPDGFEPQLALATGTVLPGLTFSIQTLPVKGTLLTSSGATISSAPFTLDDNIVVFRPSAGSTGDDEFLFQVNDGFSSASARVRIAIGPLGCVDGVDQNGRPCN